MFFYGLFVVLAILFWPDGLAGMFDRVVRSVMPRRSPATRSQIGAAVLPLSPDPAKRKALAPQALPLLSVRGLSKRFGGLVAVEQLDFDLYPGEILGIIGPNGAGKTTTFNLLAGVISATAGSARLVEREMLGLRPHRVARCGIMRTYQHNRPFIGLSVLRECSGRRPYPLRGPLVCAGLRRIEAETRAEATTDP